MATTDGRHRPRRIAAVVLVFLTCLFTLTALVGSWAGRNLLDTQRFVSRVGPAIEEPEVQEAVTSRLTREIMALVDPANLFREALDDRPAAQLLAVPLAGAVEGFVEDKIGEVVASDAFAELWNAAVRRAHAAAVKVLRDESDVIVTEDGEVRLDLKPVIQAVVARIGEAAPGLVAASGGDGTLSVDDLPDGVRARIEEAGIDLDDFGQIPVFKSDTLELAQQGVRWFDKTLVISTVLAILCAIGAVLLSTNRRRTGLQLVVGLSIVTVLLRRVVLKAEAEIPSFAATEAGADAVLVVIDRFVQPLLDFTGGALVVLALIGVVLAATGPYGWARRVRSVFTEGGWVPQHREAITPVVIGAAFVLLWFGDLDWWAMIAVVGLAVGIWFVANREAPAEESIAAPPEAPTPAPPPAPAA